MPEAMSKKNANAAKRDRVTKAHFIEEHYPEKLAENKERLCSTCKGVPTSAKPPNCELLPVTTDGENCPYYDAV